jgi:hypothetical protein
MVVDEAQIWDDGIVDCGYPTFSMTRKSLDREWSRCGFNNAKHGRSRDAGGKLAGFLPLHEIMHTVVGITRRSRDCPL